MWGHCVVAHQQICHVLVQLCWKRKKAWQCIVCLLSTQPTVHIWTGLQAAEGVHHCPGSNEVHLSRLLEDGLRERVWCDCDVVRLGGKWRGWEKENWALTVTHTFIQSQCHFPFYRRCVTSTGLLITPRGCRSTESSPCLFSKQHNRRMAS